MGQHEKEAGVNLDKLTKSNDLTGSLLDKVAELIEEFDLRIEFLESTPNEES